MLGLTTTEIAHALGATLHAEMEQPVRRVVMDSRAVLPGDLFVALTGTRTDGHQHLRQALEKGAVAALVQPDRGQRPLGLACLVVPDTLKAIGTLARFHLGRLRAEIVGITGSVGKTTAKDFLLQLVGGAATRSFAAPASYNSELGLPLAILGTPLNARLLILEYGINAPGEMEVLLGIARPQHVWITAVGASHLEGLGDITRVAEEKSKLALAVREDGNVWLDTDLAQLLQAQRRHWQARVQVSAPLAEDGLHCVSRTPGRWVLEHPRWGRLQMGLHAEHEMASALMAARIASFLGTSDEDLGARLPGLLPPQGRLSVIESGGVTILDDAYNANPQSMHAALQVLADWPEAGRRIAVLGSMRELGAESERLHLEVGRRVAQCGFHNLIGVGGGGAWIAQGVADRIPCRVVDDADGAAAILRNTLQHGDVMLLKASRLEALERIVPQLALESDPEPVAS